jgi:hypothetical protein
MNQDEILNMPAGIEMDALKQFNIALDEIKMDSISSTLSSESAEEKDKNKTSQSDNMFESNTKEGPQKFPTEKMVSINPTVTSSPDTETFREYEYRPSATTNAITYAGTNGGTVATGTAASWGKARCNVIGTNGTTYTSSWTAYA